jgi:hypothetical protein
MARYWFKPRRYGYGATPVTWEGWALWSAAAAIVAISVVAMNFLADHSNFVVWIAWAVFIAAVVFCPHEPPKNGRRMAVALECPEGGQFVKG